MHTSSLLYQSFVQCSGLKSSGFRPDLAVPIIFSFSLLL
jgi:hypothetical protein